MSSANPDPPPVVRFMKLAHLLHFVQGVCNARGICNTRDGSATLAGTTPCMHWYLSPVCTVVSGALATDCFVSNYISLFVVVSVDF